MSNGVYGRFSKVRRIQRLAERITTHDCNQHQHGLIIGQRRDTAERSRHVDRNGAISTGSRINSAKDDAAGLAIADRMGAQVSGLNMAVRNANDAISLLQTVDGAAQEISNMLNRMYELAVQAASGTYTSTDRTALDLEFGELMKEIQEIAERTEWNGTSIMDDTYDDTISTESSAWR